MFKYLQYFQLNIHYKLSKTNDISDVLSQLVSHEHHSETDQKILNILLINFTSIYSEFLVKLLFKFWQHVLAEYSESQWNHIKQIIQDNEALRLNVVTVLYVIIWNLIYYKNSELEHQLCILTTLNKEVFQLAYNKIKHSDYAKTHKWLTQDFYIHNLLKHLHKYMYHCLQC